MSIAIVGALISAVGSLGSLLGGQDSPAPPPPPIAPDGKEPEGTLDAESARARSLARRREDETTTKLTSLLGDDGDDDDDDPKSTKKKLTGE